MDQLWALARTWYSTRLEADSRRPKPEELSLLVRYVDRREGADDRAKALADVFWALLNGPEFHLNH